MKQVRKKISRGERKKCVEKQKGTLEHTNLRNYSKQSQQLLYNVKKKNKTVVKMFWVACLL